MFTSKTLSLTTNFKKRTKVINLYEVHRYAHVK